MLVCTILYMVESMSLGGLEAVFRVEFLRLTLEYPWAWVLFPPQLPLQWCRPEWWLTCGRQFNSCCFFQINL